MFWDETKGCMISLKSSIAIHSFFLTQQKEQNKQVIVTSFQITYQIIVQDGHEQVYKLQNSTVLVKNLILKLRKIFINHQKRLVSLFLYEPLFSCTLKFSGKNWKRKNLPNKNRKRSVCLQNIDFEY